MLPGSGCYVVERMPLFGQQMHAALGVGEFAGPGEQFAGYASGAMAIFRSGCRERLACSHQRSDRDGGVGLRGALSCGKSLTPSMSSQISASGLV